MALKLQLKRQVIEKLGFFPAFLIPALETPEILNSLFQQTRVAYIKNSLPPRFKEKLLVTLSRYFQLDYLTICHSCTLRALGMTAKEILAVNKLSIPSEEKELDADWQLLAQHTQHRDRWYHYPEVEQSILRCAELIFLQPFATKNCCLKLQQFLGVTVYNYLISFLGYIKLCHQWVASHPEISYEQDRRAQLHLAPLLLEEIELREFFQNNLKSAIIQPTNISSSSSQEEELQDFQLAAERFKTCFINAPFPMMIYRADGKIVHLNRNWTEITGYSESELTTTSQWRSLAAVKQQEIVRSRQICWETEFAFGQVVKSLLDFPENESLTSKGNSQVVNAIRSEVTIFTKGGERRCWELYSAPLALYFEGEELTIAIAKDVTDLIRTEAKLAEVEAKLKLVLEATKTGNWDWNITNNQVDLCHRARAILGLQQFDRTYESFLQSIHEDERQSVDLAAIKAVKAGKSLELEYRIIKPDGQIRWIRSQGKLNYDLSGNVVNLAGIVTDITDEKQINPKNSQLNQYQQSNVAQSLQELEHLLNSIPYYLFVIDVKTKFISVCNSGLSQCLGFVNPQQVQGKAIADCFPPENARHIVRQHEQVLVTKEVLRTQEEVVLPDGIHYFDTVITPLKDSQGEIYALLHTSSDIPDLAAAQQALSERTLQLEAANRELESFSYSVSHDLQAPLRVINGFSQVLWENYNLSLDDRGKHYLQRIQANSERMSELIDSLLQLSRVTRSHMEYSNVDLSAIASEIVRELQANDPERQVEFNIAPNLTAKGDPKLLSIVLNNLLDNAWKYSSKKPLAKIEFNAISQSNNKLAYFVKDNGAGFDVNYADKLFTAFKRLHNEAEFPGTGIGLATVQRIIYRHGGKVWADGECDRGATFYFSL
jgi:PAS domain S-box-containing protein